MQRKQKVPKINCKKVVRTDIPLDKVYGKGAFDENMKNYNKVNEWSFIQK